MKTISTEVIIEAGPERVWQVFTDFEKYPEWNPFIKSVLGEIKKGKRIKVQIFPPGQKKPSGFNPKLLVVRENQELRWKGRLLFPNIFDGEHYFQLFRMDNGNTLFVQGEHFEGILVSFLNSMFPKLEEGFESMNEALKDLCESGS